MGAVEARAELAADALGQFGGAEALDGVLGHLPLPVTGDGRGADPRQPLDYLAGTESRESVTQISEITVTQITASQSHRVTVSHK